MQLAILARCDIITQRENAKMNDKTQQILNQLYIDAVFNEETEKLEPPYKVNKIAYENYEKTLILLAQLKGKGKCNFTFDSIFEPYVLHCIYVQWKFDESGYIELDAKEIASILDKMEGIVIDEQNGNEWQLSSKIYF
jgi:hypothetical protein